MNRVLLFALISIGLVFGGEQNDSDIDTKFLNESLNVPGFLVEGEFLYKFSLADFSELWLSRKYEKFQIGFIGSKFQRVNVHFESIIKNPDKDHEYFVYGKSRVKDNITVFQGTLKPIHVKKWKYSDVDTLTGYMLLSEYTFYEDNAESHSGNFTGISNVGFVVDPRGNILANTGDLVADGANNNLFVGYWRGYGSKRKLMCNWGEFRVPFSGDLDIGTAEFYPNKQKYGSRGWDDYVSPWEDNRPIDKWWE